MDTLKWLANVVDNGMADNTVLPKIDNRKQAALVLVHLSDRFKYEAAHPDTTNDDTAETLLDIAGTCYRIACQLGL